MRPNSTINRAGGRIAAAALALCVAAATQTGAHAADGNEGKWYIGANIPVMFVDNTKTKLDGDFAFVEEENLGPEPNLFPYSGTITSHHGLRFRIGALVGYYVLPNLRLEGELFYGFARVKKNVHKGYRSHTDRITGNARMLGAMVNAWYDIPLDPDWIPFVGGGIGVFQVDFSGLKWDIQGYCRASLIEFEFSDAETSQCAPRPKDKDTVFAYQVGGGIGYRVNDSTTLQLSYKFQMAPGLQFDGRIDTNMFKNTLKRKSDMKIHLFEFGFRYHF